MTEEQIAFGLTEQFLPQFTLSNPDQDSQAPAHSERIRQYTQAALTIFDEANGRYGAHNLGERQCLEVQQKEKEDLNTGNDCGRECDQLRVDFMAQTEHESTARKQATPTAAAGLPDRTRARQTCMLLEARGWILHDISEREVVGKIAHSSANQPSWLGHSFGGI